MRAPRTSQNATRVAPPAAPERLKRIRRDPAFEVILGARIRAERIAAHMTQEALGAAIGLSFQQVQKYELGKDRVAVSTLQAIATALGVHPGSFFDDDAPMALPRDVTDVRDVVKIGQRIQRVRNPAVLRRLLALADSLAGSDDEQPASLDGTP